MGKVAVYVQGNAAAHGGQKRVPCFLELELEATVSYLMWVLRTGHIQGPSLRAHAMSRRF